MGWDWVKVLKEEMLDLKSDEHLSRHAATDRLAWVSSQAPARAPVPAEEWRDFHPNTPPAGGALLGWSDHDQPDAPGGSGSGFNSGPLYGGADQFDRSQADQSPAPAAPGEVPPINHFDFAMPTAPPLEFPMPQAPSGDFPGAVPAPLGGLPVSRGFRADFPATVEPQPVPPGPDQGWREPAPQAEPRFAQPQFAESQFAQPQAAESQFGLAPFGQAPVGQPLVGQPPIGQPPVGQPPIGQAPIGQPDVASSGPFARPLDHGRSPDPLVRPAAPAGYGSLPASMRMPGPGAVSSGANGSYDALVPGDQGHVLTLLIDGVLAGVALPTGAEVTVGRERQSTLVVPEAKQTVSRRAVTLVRTARRSVEATVENRNGAWVTRQMPEGTRQEFVERGHSVTLRVGDRLALDPPGTVVVGLGEPH